MQINRVDAYANDSTTNSFFERHNDYCGGCAFVDLQLASTGGDPFPDSTSGSPFKTACQHLRSLND